MPENHVIIASNEGDLTACYQITPLSPSRQLIDVLLTLTHLPIGWQSISLQLPSWIPGSYLIRDFCKHIITLDVVNNEDGGDGGGGEKANLSQVTKNRWLLTPLSPTHQIREVQIRYRIFANDRSVRSSYYDDQYLFFNGTSVFLEPFVEISNGHLQEVKRFLLTINPQQLPEHLQPHWSIATAMPPADKTVPTSMIYSLSSGHTFATNDYLSFVDYPVVVGEFTHFRFDAAGIAFCAIFTGTIEYDTQRLIPDLSAIADHHKQLFNSKPVDHYLYLVLTAEDGYGGLEHLNSTALLYPRWSIPTASTLEQASPHAGTLDSKAREQYVQFLALCSHEFFHTWHVKRIKPSVMVNPNLSAEVFTEQLWIYEGFTSYWDEFALLRAGCITVEEYLQLLSITITRVLNTPGRKYQTLAASSFTAWTKFYQQTASSNNQIVSYYSKGAITAFALDVYLRSESQDNCSLISLMRLLWQHYGASSQDEQRPYHELIGTPDSIIGDLCQQYLNIDVTAFLTNAVSGTSDLPLSQICHSIGLEFTLVVDEQNLNAGQHNFGAKYREKDTGLELTQIIEQSPIADAGLIVGDHIIAVNGYQVTKQNIKQLLAYGGEKTSELHFLRDGRLLKGELQYGPAVANKAELTVADQATFDAFIRLHLNQPN